MQVDWWLEDEWQKLLPTEGANLRLPGNKVVAETACLDQAKRSIWRLIEHLRVAGVTKTTANVSATPRTVRRREDLRLHRSAGGK